MSFKLITNSLPPLFSTKTIKLKFSTKHNFTKYMPYRHSSSVITG